MHRRSEPLPLQGASLDLSINLFLTVFHKSTCSETGLKKDSGVARGVSGATAPYPHTERHYLFLRGGT